MPEAKYVQLASIEKEGKQTESVIGIQSEYCPMTDAIRKHPIDSVKRQYNSTCNFSWGDIYFVIDAPSTDFDAVRETSHHW